MTEEPDQTEEPQKKPRYPLELTVIGIAVLFYLSKFGSMVTVFVGFPIFFVCLWIAGGGRMPAKVANKDALIYIGVGVALVLGIILFVMLTK